MPLYKVGTDKLDPVPVVTFSSAKVMERRDLQRLLKADVSVLGDELLVIAEEFSNWEDSSRRIDLLCIDRQARLVVVEIKRTEDGGHMELQAIRYAAMVSSMTLDQCIEAYAKELGDAGSLEPARKAILDFIDADSEESVELSGDIRIVLVSADFSQELTTSVLWLNRHDLDITCIRLQPYKLGDQILVDATQIIPLPETADYEVKLRQQEKETKKVRNARGEILRRFWASLIDASKSKTSLLSNRSTTSDHWISAGIGRSGFSLNASLTEDRARVEVYIRLPGSSDEVNLAVFNQLLSQKAAIEREFGAPLQWQDLPGRLGCRICADLEGGWKSPESAWGELQARIIDCLIRMEKALRPAIQRIDA